MEAAVVDGWVCPLLQMRLLALIMEDSEEGPKCHGLLPLLLRDDDDDVLKVGIPSLRDGSNIMFRR